MRPAICFSNLSELEQSSRHHFETKQNGKDNRLRDRNLLRDALQGANEELLILRTRALEDAAQMANLKLTAESRQREIELLRERLRSSTLANQEWADYCSDLKESNRFHPLNCNIVLQYYDPSSASSHLVLGFALIF